MNITKTKQNKNERNEIVEFRRNPNVEIEHIEQEMFGNTNATPLGQLLEMIGSLPEIRQEKVYNVRDRLNTQSYDMDNTLDSAIDKVLEELLSES